jgi:hypothetical protein
MNSLHLHIDRIVIDGLPAHEQRRFARVLEAHLDEFARSGIADRFTANTRKAIQSLNAGTLRNGATAEHAAAQVVQSLRQSIAPAPRGNHARAAAKPSAGEARRHV